MLRPDFLDKLDAVAANARALVLASAANASRTDSNRREGGGGEDGGEGGRQGGGRREAELWVTELGGAYNSGRPGVTDVFLSSFWYLDALGVLTRTEADIILSNLPHALTGAVLTRLNRKMFRRAVVAVHERDDLELSAREAETLILEPLLTLDEHDFTPLQPFKSKLILVTRRP